MRRRFRLTTSIFTIATAFLTCSTAFAQNNGSVAPNQAAPKTIDVVAVINGQKLTRNKLGKECLTRFGEQVLENMVYKQLILNACQENKIVITEGDIENELARMAQRFRITKEQYVQTMTKRLNTDVGKYYRDVVWPALALRRLAAPRIKVDPADIKKRMDAKFGPRVQVQMIVLDDQTKAQQILAAAKDPKNDFGKLAKDHSVDPATASIRGRMRPISLNAFEPEVENAVFKLQPGEVSDVVAIKNQFLIFKCERLYAAAQLTNEQAAMQEKLVERELFDEKLTSESGSIMEELQKRYEVVNVYNDAKLRTQMPGVAATIGNQQIKVRNLSEECIARHGKQVLDGEINRELLTSALNAKQLQVAQADIDAEVDRAADAYGYLTTEGKIDRERWLEFVTQQDGVTVDLYVRDAVWPTAALKKLVEGSVEVTQEDMQKAFEANFGRRVEVLAIVCNSDRQAQQVWKMASQNQSNEFFGELASKYSVEPGSRENFGQVPPIAMHGGRPQLEKIAFGLKTGELSGLVNVGQQWIILKCLGQTEPVVVDPEEVKSDLYKDILEKKTRISMNKTFDKIHSEAQIDNFLAGTTQAGRAGRTASKAGVVPTSRSPFSRRPEPKP
jgi:parvulin-like peptidyl-prolyl isomerase